MQDRELYRQLLGLDSSFLGISATLRVVEQSLLGGGTMRTEFPVILNLIYESAGGDNYRWRTGLYARPPADDDPNGADLKRYDVLVPSGQWYDLDTGNLLDPANPFGFAQRELPRQGPPAGTSFTAAPPARMWPCAGRARRSS